MTRSRLLSTPRSFLFTTGDNRPVYGIRLGFQNINGSQKPDTRDEASNFHVDIKDISTRQVRFTFSNTDPQTRCITEIYINDECLLSIAVQIVMEADATDDPPHGLPASARQESAPRPYHDSTNFQAVRGLPEQAASAPVHEGLCRNESLEIVFDLQAGIDFADIVNALCGGKLNIGIKIQDTDTGDSMLFINTTQLVLSPTSPADCTQAVHTAGSQ